MFQSNFDNTSPDHVYLDCICTNNTGDNPQVPLAFSEIRDSEIIQNCSDYYLTISRFYMETPNLPVLLMPILTGQTDINKSSLSVTMTFKAFEVQTYLRYVPTNTNVSLPNAPLINVDYNNNYYDIYSYQNFIQMLNTAFLNCFNALNTASGGTLTTANFPYMEYDPNAGKGILNADMMGFNNSLQYPISIYFNTELFQLFSSFDANYYGNNVTNGKNYKLNIYELPNLGNVYTITSPTTINYLQMYQEYSTLASVGNPISSIVFNTALIPVAGSLQSKPVIFNAPASISDQTSNSTVVNMLTDIIVDSTMTTGYKPNIIYNANPFRLISLSSNAPLRNYDISVFYKLNTGNLRPFLLMPGATASIKIVFIKKSAPHI
jgi:hypothetical protein